MESFVRVGRDIYVLLLFHSKLREGGASYDVS
jgi:hypothetical protein